tara:strand:+ start:417 stop:665 length:249 start_codon:yes stop_codon:yes gene_type:complete
VGLSRGQILGARNIMVDKKIKAHARGDDRKTWPKKLRGMKVHQIKDHMVGILDEDNKLVAQGSSFMGGAISWKWIRKDYQDG